MDFILEELSREKIADAGEIDPDDILIMLATTKIIAEGPAGETVMILAENWEPENPESENDSFMSLSEIADKLQKHGYQPVYYVWHEQPLAGEIYEYGNTLEDGWVLHGKTKGYA